MIKKNIIVLIMGACVITSCDNSKVSKAEYEGKDITDIASIVRDKNTKAANLIIDKDIKWDIYQGYSVETIDFSKPLLSGNTKGSYPLEVENNRRSYFELVTPEGKAIMAERHLPLEGGYNFRDLGGIQNKEGKYTKWGKVFRSDELNLLTEKDLEYLDKLPLTTVVDFRSPPEIEQSEDRVPASVKESYQMNLFPGNLTGSDIESLLSLTAEEGDSIMKAVNRQLVSDPASYEQYKKFFKLLGDENNTPLVFHCTAGKDRTGYGAYLFLSALGVDEETIMKDYLSSNEYLKEKYGPYMTRFPNLAPLFEVRKEYLQSAIDEIKEKYDSVESYLTNILKVDLAKIQNMYLYN